MIRTTLLVLAFATTAQAQPLPQVFASLASDLDADGDEDLAILSGTYGAQLTVLLADADGNLSLAVQTPALIGSGGPSETPSLSVTQQGSLQITSSNYGIGRHKWEAVLTIAFRKSNFVLAGLTWSEFDSLTQDSWRKCDINLLTGVRITETVDGTVRQSLPEPAPQLDSLSEESVWNFCAP